MPGTPSAEFLSLTEKYLAGECTPEELARWEALCLADPEALAYYVSLARVEALVPRAAAALDAENERPKVVPFWRRPAFAAAACFAFAFAGVAVFKLRPASPPALAAAPDTVPACVTGSFGVRWTEGGAPQGSRLKSASGAFSAGVLELTMDSGARLLVQGPASFAVTGPNALNLAAGKVVADVPPPARGFTLTGPRDRIVDHGTRFAAEVAGDGSRTTLGVLSGEVELFNASGGVRLFTDYAVRREGDVVRSVPFDKAAFVTEAPSREFAWNLDGARLDVSRTFSYDVTPLVSGPGDYRAVVRWLLGLDAISVKSLRLVRDGATVASATAGRSGLIGNTRDNAPVLHVTPADYRPGRWTLVLEAYADGSAIVPGSRPANSSGVISFEEGLSVSAGASRFLGRWRYSYNGVDCVREFLPDGRVRYYERGRLTAEMARCRWTVEGGVLDVEFPAGSSNVTEKHMLRDDRTLVFLNRPYRNAHRE